MSNAMRSETPIETPRTQPVDTKLEVVVIPVSDVDAPSVFTTAWVGGSTPTSPMMPISV